MSENDEKQTEGSQLRQQLEAALAENKELRSYKRSNELSPHLKNRGYDPSKGPGAWAIKHYEGDLDGEAFASWLDENDLTPLSVEESPAPKDQEPPVGMKQRVSQQDRLTAVRDVATPASAQRISKDELAALEKSDPRAAVKAWQEGRVEGMTPPAA